MKSILYCRDSLYPCRSCYNRLFVILFAVFILIGPKGYAQRGSRIVSASQLAAGSELSRIPPEGLQIGDLVPDVPIRNIINYPGGTARLSDFKDQLLIIEFGNTRCSPCIASQEKLANLEKKLNGKFKLLAVSYEPTEIVQKLVDRRKWTFAFATRDTLLKKLFPHLAVPHLVWIRDNRVLAITDAYEASAENILPLIRGENVEFTLKRDKKYDPEERFTGLDPEGNTTLFYSHLTGYQRGIGTYYARRKLDNGNVKYSWVNHDAVMLILEAFKGGSPYYLKYRNRVRVAVSDSLMRKLSMYYKLPAKDGIAQQKWIQNQGISYEIEVPLKNEGNVKGLMQKELKAFFKIHYGIEVAIEKRKVPSLALLRTSSDDLLRTAGGRPDKTVKEDFYSIKNAPIHWFLDNLLRIHRNQPLPIVNKTDYPGNVDLSIQGGLGDITLLNRELKKYGLTLQKKSLEIDMLIIRQVGSEGKPMVLEERSLLPYYGIKS